MPVLVSGRRCQISPASPPRLAVSESLLERQFESVLQSTSLVQVLGACLAEAGRRAGSRGNDVIGWAARSCAGARDRIRRGTEAGAFEVSAVEVRVVEQVEEVHAELDPHFLSDRPVLR